ncbi:MAG: hypothetical protein ABID64_02750 [Nitrospirota bacterium]
MERIGGGGNGESDERVPHSYDGTPDNFEGLPEELKDLRVRFRVGKLIIPRNSGCTAASLSSQMVQITTPDGEDFRIPATFVRWEE